MILNIALLICFGLMVYSYFMFLQDTHKYTKLLKIVDITNLTVTDTYPNKIKKISHGQYSKMWFTEMIFKYCDKYLYGTYEILYDGLEKCLPAPYCKNKGDFQMYVKNAL